MDEYKAMYQATEKFRDTRFHHWLEYDLFSVSWWLLLALTVFPWFIWWKLADKRRMVELICFGSIIVIISIILDTIGTTNLWWMYKTELFTQFPGLLTPDLTDIPVVFMLIYQYFSKWTSYMIGMVVMSALFSYVIEPLFRHVDIYNPLGWLHFYSFIIYILMTVFAKWLVQTLKTKEKA